MKSQSFFYFNNHFYFTNHICLSPTNLKACFHGFPWLDMSIVSNFLFHSFFRRIVAIVPTLHLEKQLAYDIFMYFSDFFR